MKVTYTADDGNNFETEADCLGWERFIQLRDKAINTPTDPDDPKSWDEDFYTFMSAIAADESERGWGRIEMSQIWLERKHLYRIAELMKQAEVN